MNYNDYYNISKKIRIKYLKKTFIELLVLKIKYNSQSNTITNVYEVFNELENEIPLSHSEKKSIVNSCIKERYITDNSGNIIKLYKV